MIENVIFVLFDIEQNRFQLITYLERSFKWQSDYLIGKYKILVFAEV
jgi:hypothetical protein